ncbi:hypothetical protein AX16_004945 [Volvariella volvacea WC 439]|nr:hypothetical protein AX16_004945 [Volvariella volvacea WC 439]
MIYSFSEYLASFTWSSDEKSFIYTAEANPPSSKDSDDPYARFRYKPHLGEGLVGKRRPTLFLLHLDHTVQTRQSKLFQLSIPSQPNVLFGQAVFAPSSTIPSNDGQVMIEAIYATGYEYLQDGRLLGVKGCYNRPTGIWEIILPVPIADKATIKGKPKHTEVDNNDDDDTTIRCTARKFTPPYQSCRSPRIYSAANGLYTVVYLVSSTGGAHASTTSVFKFQQLARRRWFNGEGELVTEEGIGEGEDAQPVQLVDFEPTPSLAEPESTASTTTTTTAIATASTTFGNLPGFYPTGSNLPANAFIYTGLQQSTPGPWVISSSAHGSRSTVVLVDTTQRYASLRDLTPPPPPTPSTTSSHPPSQSRSGDDLLWSWNVLTTDLHRRVVCTRSAINRVPEILLGTLDENGDVEWVVIDDGLGDVSEDLKNQLSKLEISVHAIPGRYPTETILVRHVDSTKDTPLVTVPHGGPHGTTTTAFTPTTTALALEGYTISLPNYTGSLGYGENAVRALLGQCGSLDVEDCVSSVRYLIEKGYATEGPGKLFIMGGSHGGFLTAHCKFQRLYSKL